MVVRDGEEEIVPSMELVPGDVVVLDEGDASIINTRIFTDSSC